MWKNHPVTKHLFKGFEEEQKALVNFMVSGVIDVDSMHDKNFKLGRLALLSELLDIDYFEELVDDIYEQQRGE